jgi:dephospho-CoA kinase
MRVALTGGIASGKSTVSGFMAAAGIPVIDADEIALELASPGSKLVQELAGALGPWVVGADGALDRATLRDRAFDDPRIRGTLERISHPAIRAEMESRAARLETDAPFVLLVIPLLIEAGWQSVADQVVVVDCDPALQAARLHQRRGMDAELAEKIISTQADRAVRLEIADHVIVNGGDRAALERESASLLAKLSARIDEAV